MKRAIVLVDHGSRREEANRQLVTLCGRLALRTPDHIVEPAHMEIAAPGIGDAVEACVARGAEEIVVQPWFLAPGRHTVEDIPRLVAEARARHPRVVFRIGEPLGIDDALIELLLARIEDAHG